MKTAYQKTTLTGGGATALDGINGSALLDGDFAFVEISGVTYKYILDDDLSGTEVSPYKIAPDTNPGTKRWVLQQDNALDEIDALLYSPHTFTQATIEAAFTAIGTTNKVTL